MQIAQPRSNRNRTGDEVRRYVGLFVLLVGLVIILFPLLFMISMAFSTFQQIIQFPPSLIPDPWVWTNFSDGFAVFPFGRYYWNSTVIAVLRVIGAVASCSLAGYAFARLRAPGREVLFVLVLSTLMLPYAVTVIPQYVMFRTFGWLDSYKPLIVPAFFGGGPFLIFLFRQFFRSIPEEVFEAARLDGCGYFGIYRRILLPLSGPVLATACILTFQNAWDDFLAPLIYITSNDKYTLTLGLAAFRSGFGATPWHQLMAVSLVVALPPVLLFLLAQRRVLAGIVVTSK